MGEGPLFLRGGRATLFCTNRRCYRQGMLRFRLMAPCAILCFLSSCGYQLQGRHNPYKELGVEKIYVVQFQNRTYRPGVEQFFATALVREIKKANSFRLVNSEEEADAVLYGEVTSVGSGVASTKSVDIIDDRRINLTTKSVDVASQYTASVSCSVRLVDRHKRVLFSQSVSSDKIYPGAALVGDAGATGPLTNDSEQRLAVQFLASQMMASMYQSLSDFF